MSRDISAAIKGEFNKLNWLAVIVFLSVLALQGIAFYYVMGDYFGMPLQGWLRELAIASAVFVFVALINIFLIASFGRRTRRKAYRIFSRELRQLRAANNRAQSLREMATVLRATLSFERVVEEALNVCSLALEEMGIPRKALAGAVFLFSGQRLMPVATRRFLGTDSEKNIPGQRGIIGQAFAQAEVTVTNNPSKDPELRTYAAFQNALTAVCIPLRAGFQIFGAMVITSNVTVKFNEDHFDLFTSVADQAVIALQNAQLYQRLEAEKQRLIEADEEARKELARDLHDGPTQSIAAIAMRINFIRSLVRSNPEQVLSELQKVEDLAKQTSYEIRGMLFTLRPLVLETQGLAVAIESVMKRIEETDGLRIRFVGGENSDLLNENAQSVVFSIVEEALGNSRKHAEASQIEVRFWREENLFVAHVQDDGTGYDTTDVNRDYSTRGSLGMVNMRERAERIDGSLRIESSPRQGTTVTLVVPLEKQGRQRPAIA
jgi:signal transduction histidine kinase